MRLDHFLEKDLVTAAQEGDLPGVKAALAEADNSRGTYNSALNAAAEHGHVEIVDLLLREGAYTTQSCGSALYCGAKSGHASVVGRLLAARADVHATEDLALRAAVDFGHTAVVRVLIEAGANVHVNDGEPIYTAVLTGKWAVAGLLLRAGAEVTSDLSAEKQVAACSSDAVLELSAARLARQGFCPEALCVLLDRQGHGEIAALIQATQMLEHLTPEGRAEMLETLLAAQPESTHVAP